jgi:hypothetical protein
LKQRIASIVVGYMIRLYIHTYIHTYYFGLHNFGHFSKIQSKAFELQSQRCKNLQRPEQPSAIWKWNTTTTTLAWRLRSLDWHQGNKIDRKIYNQNGVSSNRHLVFDLGEGERVGAVEDQQAERLEQRHLTKKKLRVRFDKIYYKCSVNLYIEIFFKSHIGRNRLSVDGLARKYIEGKKLNVQSFLNFLVSDPLCLSSFSAIHFSKYSFCIPTL